MTSDNKVAANRANARKSTGPRTKDGKTRSSRNATRHGFFSLTPPPQLDRDEAFCMIEGELRDELHPRSPTQHTLLRELAIQTWRLSKIPDYERDVLANAPDDADELALLSKVWSLHDRCQSRYQSLLRQFRREQDATTKQRQQESQNEPKPETAWQRQERLYDEDPKSEIPMPAPVPPIEPTPQRVQDELLSGVTCHESSPTPGVCNRPTG